MSLFSRLLCSLRLTLSQLNNLTSDGFLSGMDWFLNQTASISTCGGLRTYICPLLALPRPDFIPDEIALLQYESEAEYKSFYSTPLGQYYQGLHERFFNMTLSHSLVPVGYGGSVKTGNAYCTPDCNVEWNDFQASTSTFYNHSENINAEAVEDIVAQIERVPGLAAAVFGVYDQYVKLFSFWKNALARAKGAAAVASILASMTVVGNVSQPAENVQPPLTLAYGTTVNVTILPCDIQTVK